MSSNIKISKVAAIAVMNLKRKLRSPSFARCNVPGTAQLAGKFKSVIQSKLDSVGATRYYSEVATTYNKVPFMMNKINPDISDYVTQKAVDGLLVPTAAEELNIRKT